MYVMGLRDAIPHHTISLNTTPTPRLPYTESLHFTSQHIRPAPHSPRYTTLSTGATDWRAERTDGWVRWMGDPLIARRPSSAPGTSARLGSHSGGGMIVQRGGAMYLLSSSTATVADARLTHCAADDVRDGLIYATPNHTTPYPSTPRPLHAYPTPQASTPHHNT